MSQTYSKAQAHATKPSAWAVGWTMFASIIMAVQGLWWLMAGFVALVNNEFYVVGSEYVFQFDVTTWGWIHVLVGAIVLAAGLGLISGATWARVVGVIVASLAMLVAFAWLPWYPIWATLFILASASVIWALTAHGRDLAAV